MASTDFYSYWVPLSCFLMNLRGFGASDITVYPFFGSMLMHFADLMELILGSTSIAVGKVICISTLEHPVLTDASFSL